MFEFNPLISNDGVNLNAQSVVPENLTSSLVASSSATLKTLVKGVKNNTLVVTVSATLPAGATLSFTGSVAGGASVALPLYNADGSIAFAAGVLSTVGTYWADLSGLDTVNATTNAFGAGTVNLVSSLSNYSRPKGVTSSTVTPGIFSGQTYKTQIGTVPASATTGVIAGVANQTIYVVGLQLSTTVAATPVQARITDGGPLTTYYYQTNSDPVTQTGGTNQPYLYSTAVGSGLSINNTQAAILGYQFGYYQF
jgi:hypothetical protein